MVVGARGMVTVDKNKKYFLERTRKGKDKKEKNGVKGSKLAFFCFIKYYSSLSTSYFQLVRQWHPSFFFTSTLTLFALLCIVLVVAAAVGSGRELVPPPAGRGVPGRTPPSPDRSYTGITKIVLLFLVFNICYCGFMYPLKKRPLKV